VSRLALDAGHDVVGYDVAELAPEALPVGLALAASPAAAAQGSDCVLIAVYNDEQVLGVVTGADGLLAATDPAPAAVILSTVTLETIRQAQAASIRHGVHVLDCGVSGGPALAAGSKLAIAVGGDGRVIERVRAVLDAFGDPVVVMGGLGSGMAAKLARNLLHYCSALVDWEAARLASDAGVDIESFARFIKSAETKGVGRMGYVTPATRHGVLSPPLRLARYGHKDLQAALALGQELNVELPTAVLADGTFTDLLAASGE
jgi:3-hydroxyisobutyrate dehydrogenase-like beta-hydroxyacid dehydrogenase